MCNTEPNGALGGASSGTSRPVGQLDVTEELLTTLQRSVLQSAISAMEAASSAFQEFAETPGSLNGREINDMHGVMASVIEDFDALTAISRDVR